MNVMLYEIVIKRKTLKSRKTAVIDGTKKYSYHDLKEKVDSLLILFHSLRIRKHRIIGIFLDNSIHYIALLLAIQKMRAVSLPVNTRISKAELAKIIKQFRINCLVIGKKYLNMVEPLQPEFIRMDKDDYSIIIAKSVQSAVPAGKKSVSMICLTSGTTGDPKGVMLSRKNLISNCRSVIHTMQITSGDSLFIIKSLYYISSLSELFTALLLNCTIIIYSGVFLPEYIRKTAEALKPTFLCGVPVMFNLLIEYLEKKQKRFIMPGKILIVGSAANQTLIRKLLLLFPESDIYIGYGLTEAAPRVTTLKINDNLQLMHSAGKPVRGVKVRIRKNGKRGRPGETGEICVKGRNVFAGYFNDPDAGKRKIVRSWLLTGDMGYIDKDNNLFIVGRNDDIINKGGIKIAPGEIENLISMIDGVREAAVVGEPCDMYNERIRAFVVKKKDFDFIDHRYIRQFLEKYISAFKIPDAIEFCEALPRNANGKITRKELLMRNKLP